MSPADLIRVLAALTLFGVVLLGASFVAGGTIGALLAIPGVLFSGGFGFLLLAVWWLDRKGMI
jgi:hypothetical protein